MSIERPSLPLVNVGIDVAQRYDYSAVAVAETEERSVGGRPEWFYHVRWLEQLELGLKYSQQAEYMVGRILRLADQLEEKAREFGKRDFEWAELTDKERRRRAESRICVYCDVTGVGRGVGDLLTDALFGTAVQVWFVTFVAGDVENRVPSDPREIRLGKTAMVAGLSVRLEQRRIELPDSETAQLAMRQLEDYERTVRPDDGHETYGGKRLHDDLVVALALSTHFEPRIVRTIQTDWAY